MKDLIQKHKIIVCAGSGGVGKTTVASAIALRAASMGRKVLLFTIDPSRRLATCLGLNGWTGEEVSVQKFPSGGELFASMVDHAKIFDDFVREHSPSEVEAQKMLSNRLYKELSTNLSGSQEFTSLRALEKAVSDAKYDFIVLDTPPAQHTLDFVKAPQVLFQLFSGPVVDWFRKLTQKRAGFFGLLNKGTQAAISVLERITGAEFITELQDFFVHVSHWSPSIQDMVIKTQKILMNADTGFLVVANLDDSRLLEAQDNIREFKRLGFSVKAIIINRMTPTFKLDVINKVPQSLQNFYSKLKSSETEQIQSIFDQRLPGTELLSLPKINMTQDEVENLKILAEHFKRL